MGLLWSCLPGGTRTYHSFMKIALCCLPSVNFDKLTEVPSEFTTLNVTVTCNFMLSSGSPLLSSSCYIGMTFTCACSIIKQIMLNTHNLSCPLPP